MKKPYWQNPTLLPLNKSKGHMRNIWPEMETTPKKTKAQAYCDCKTEYHAMIPVETFEDKCIHCGYYVCWRAESESR